jgi:hypothetical protein
LKFLFFRRFNKDVEHDYSEAAGLWQSIDDDGPEDMRSPTITKESGCWGGYYKDYIDHIVLGQIAKSKFVNGSFEQLGFDQKYTKQLSRNLSDHCPISLELKL